MSEVALLALSPIRFAELDEATAVNAALMAAFAREAADPATRRTHHFGGRYENTYVALERIPELVPVHDFALQAARQLLARTHLRQGFWFNEMHPGQRTTPHDHTGGDELLSGVYYVNCPADSGRLVLHDDEAVITVTPRPGLLVLFPPDLPHEVEEHRGQGTRLSVAFNFGPPPEPAT
jgi:hypothetical protein